MPRERGTHEVPHEIRVAIIVMKYFFNLRWKEIAQRLNLHPRTVSVIWQRAIARTTDPTDFREIAASTSSLERSGRPSIIIDGTPASQQLRDLFTTHFELPFEVVAEYFCGLKVARSTLERIAHDHRDSIHPYPLARRIQPLKPALSIDHKDLRQDFAQWALREIARGALFIFTDESYIEFGGHRYTSKRPRITRPIGHPDPFEFASHIELPQFKLMLWSAIGPLATFPFWIWDKEKEDREVVQRQLNQENQDRNQRSKEKIQEAK